LIDYLDNPEIIVRQSVSKILREICNERVPNVIEQLLPILQSPATDTLIMSSMKILIGTYGRRNSAEVMSDNFVTELKSY
jgi:hypothetical protein